MNTLGERLVHARKYRGYKTQEALAAATNNVVTRNAIANIESGRSNAQPAVIDILCRTLRIEKRWLEDGDEYSPMEKVTTPSSTYDKICQNAATLNESQKRIVLDLINSMKKHLPTDEPTNDTE